MSSWKALSYPAPPLSSSAISFRAPKSFKAGQHWKMKHHNQDLFENIIFNNEIARRFPVSSFYCLLNQTLGCMIMRCLHCYCSWFPHSWRRYTTTIRGFFLAAFLAAEGSFWGSSILSSLPLEADCTELLIDASEWDLHKKYLLHTQKKSWK